MKVTQWWLFEHVWVNYIWYFERCQGCRSGGSEWVTMHDSKHGQSELGDTGRSENFVPKKLFHKFREDLNCCIYSWSLILVLVIFLLELTKTSLQWPQFCLKCNPQRGKCVDFLKSRSKLWLHDCIILACRHCRMCNVQQCSLPVRTMPCWVQIVLRPHRGEMRWLVIGNLELW